jgi:hypothetical protein
MSVDRKLSAEEWLATDDYKGIQVLDPDGWDRKNYDVSWAEKITKNEFERRLVKSTCRWPPGFFDRLLQKVVAETQKAIDSGLAFDTIVKDPKKYDAIFTFWKNVPLTYFATYNLVEKRVVTSEFPFFEEVARHVRSMTDFSYTLTTTESKTVAERT